MRLHRFYVSQPLGEEVVIEDVSLIKQWTKVFRYTEGDFVILFNGEGYDVFYSLNSITPKECSLVRNQQSPAYIPDRKVTLYLSLIKKDNFELVVQKATELGVTTIVPFISERSEKKNLNRERLIKIAIEASEQCGRGDVPTILPIVTLSDVLDANPPHDVMYVLQMGGVSLSDNIIQNKIKSIKNIALFIGPEGGWSDREESLFVEHTLTSISLGKTVLRAETAAIVACGCIGEIM
jgi:16S rRNA (uracil1498-N3)-methyltransferase